MAISNLIYYCEGFFYDRFSRECKNLERQIDKIVPSGQSDLKSFSTILNLIESLKSRVDGSDDPQQKSCLINRLASLASAKIDFVEDMRTKEMLSEKVRNLFYESFCRLPRELFAHIAQFLQPADAARLLPVNRQFYVGILSNRKLKQKIFWNRDIYSSRQAHFFASARVISDIFFQELYLLTDAQGLSNIIKKKPDLIHQFDRIYIQQSEERKEVDRLIRTTREAGVKLKKQIKSDNENLNKIDMKLIQIRIDLIDFLLSNREFLRLGRSEISYTKLKSQYNHLQFDREIVSKKLFVYIENLKKTFESIDVAKAEIKKKEQIEMTEALSLLSLHLKPYSKIQHIAAYKNSEELKTVYLKVRGLQLEIEVKEESTYSKSHFEQLILSLDEAALAFAEKDPESGMSKCEELPLEINEQISFYLKENENHDLQIKNLYGRRYKKNFRNSDKLTICVEMLRAIEDVKELLMIHQKFSQMKTSSMQKQILIDCIRAFLNNECIKGMEEFQKLDANIHYLLKCECLPELKTSYFIPPDSQILSSDKDYFILLFSGLKKQDKVRLLARAFEHARV